MDRSEAWVHRGFDEFSKGSFDDGDTNLYVNAKGVIETIHRTDVNNDGYVDIVLPNGQGYEERGPTSAIPHLCSQTLHLAAFRAAGEH